MIVIPDRKAVIITPPKCGSTTLHHLLMPFGYRVDGPQFGKVDDIGKHTTSLTYGTFKYKVYCLIRDPRDRFVSIYNHYVRDQGFISPEQFIEGYTGFYGFYSYSIRQLVEDHKIVGVIRLENLVQDVYELFGLNVQTVTLNENKNTPCYIDIKAPYGFIERDLPDVNDSPIDPYAIRVRVEVESGEHVLPDEDSGDGTEDSF